MTGFVYKASARARASSQIRRVSWSSGKQLAAYHAGVVTSLAGIIPNSVLHLVLAAGFGWFWRRGSALEAHPREAGERSHALAE